MDILKLSKAYTKSDIEHRLFPRHSITDDSWHFHISSFNLHPLETVYSLNIITPDQPWPSSYLLTTPLAPFIYYIIHLLSVLFSLHSTHFHASLVIRYVHYFVPCVMVTTSVTIFQRYCLFHASSKFGFIRSIFFMVKAHVSINAININLLNPPPRININ